MTNNILFELSVKFFSYCDLILSSHISNWNDLGFAYKASHLLWIIVAVLFHVVLYNIILYVAIKTYPHFKIFISKKISYIYKIYKN